MSDEILAMFVAAAYQVAASTNKNPLQKGFKDTVEGVLKNMIGTYNDHKVVPVSNSSFVSYNNRTH